MKIFSYIKKYGLKHLIDVIYQYKIDLIIQKIILQFLKNIPLKDVIIIESHNDFDNNGGAFYRYLINNQYNKIYRIVWLIKNRRPDTLPTNVKCYPLYKPSIMKNYYICVAKYFTADCVVSGKVRSNQKSYYLTHGAFALKNTSGKVNVPSRVDYILIPSESTRSLQKIQFNPQPETKMISIGFPLHDQLLSLGIPQLYKLKGNIPKGKIIIWMPTFRKGGGYQRNDSTAELPLGIPIIEDDTQLVELNRLLAGNDSLLIIKIHPMQDMSTVHIGKYSNIYLLTGTVSKELHIDNYELLKETDALISDYSSVTYDYLFLNKPIGYVFSDLNDYKNGLITDTPEDFMAGPIINDFYQLKDFISSILVDADNYKKERAQLINKIFEYHDSNSCRRLVEHMGLKSRKDD